MSLSYDSNTGGYTVRNAAGTSATFLPASKVASDDKVVTEFRQTSGNVIDHLILFNPGAANSQLALTYVSYGAWQRVTDNGTTIDAAQQYFVYGIRQAADRPSTGFGSYATTVEGFWTNPDGIFQLAGDADFTADFAAMTVTTTLDLTSVHVDGQTTKKFGLFDGSGTIAAMGGGFAGTLVHRGTDADGNVYSGSFAGAFFGPQGQEMGYSFSLTGNGGVAAGAVVGKAQ